MESILVSASFMVITILLAVAIRGVIRSLIAESLLQNCLLEFIATAELCACYFEVVVVSESYGISVSCFLLFLLLMWWSLTWRTETACPYRPLEDILEGWIYPEEGLLYIFAQVCGGLSIFPYVHAFWELELTESHAGRDYANCTSDLRVDLYFGFLIEGLGTLLSRLVSRRVADMNIVAAGLIKAFCTISLIIIGIDFTGGYYNPAIATSMKFGCKGSSIQDHIVVYWGGPIMGSFLSVILFYLCLNSRSIKVGVDAVGHFFPERIQYGRY